MGFIGFLWKYYGEESARNAFGCIPDITDFAGCLYNRNALEQGAYGR